MEKEQELEWLEAQKITFGVDLMAAAKKQLKFLAAVDRRRWLYEGPGLDRAIHRYKNCWLPLLAKHSESASEDSIAVPLDCEWIWHCHRLNPAQYKRDCRKIFGRILDTKNVESSLAEHSKSQMIDKWNTLYPEEPFELEHSYFTDSSSLKNSGSSDVSADVVGITYDLVSAVKRQCSFYYQVARPTMNDDGFLGDAVARYKGFLHVVRIRQERSLKLFCVPTYDIDLIWHSHQLQPLAYCNDTEKLFGRVFEHDDTDSDRSKGKRLDTGFTDTTKLYEDTFGLRYWRAGAMYRGTQPTALPATHAYNFKDENSSKLKLGNNYDQSLPLSETLVVEVLLEIVRIKHLPPDHVGELFVICNKKRPDKFFDGCCTLNISSKVQQKQVAGFECEPSGELVLALMCRSTPSSPAKTIGKTSVSLKELLLSELSVEKWFELKTDSSDKGKHPLLLHVAASFTTPVPSSYVLHWIRSPLVSKNSCFFQLPRKARQSNSWTRFLEENGKEIVSLKMRKNEKNDKSPMREVVGVSRFWKELCLLAEYAGNVWLLRSSNFTLHTKNETSENGPAFELSGEKQVKIFSGSKLEYERKGKTALREQDFFTVVEFSFEDPYGKAVALIDFKTGLLEVNQASYVLPAILLAFIFLDMLMKKDYGHWKPEEKNVTDINSGGVNNTQNLNKAASSLLAEGFTGTKVPTRNGDCANIVNGKEGGGVAADVVVAVVEDVEVVVEAE